MNKVNNPVSTYRVQLHKDFNFNDLRNIVDYLYRLGVKTLYASPVFESMPGSTHGYDGTNPNHINPEIGTQEELVSLSKLFNDKGIGWLQDIVPNHLSFHQNNKWLMDVLEKGSASEYADFFDIIWDHPDYGNRLMVPFPGSPLESYLRERFPGEEHYKVTDWKETDRRINYRRFFTVNNLICTNVQYDHVFQKYHELAGRLAKNNTFQGLRVDHIDGLYDPKKYLEQLRALTGESTYVVVEKILEPRENLPDDWDVQGTSGYEFLGMVNNLFTNAAGLNAFDKLYFQITANDTKVQDQIKEKKSYILFNHMGGELDNLVHLYKQCGGGAGMNDEGIKKRISDYLIRCPVYRYYGKDIPYMDQDIDNSNEQLQAFYQRAMQFTGPLMAKGVEDTLMYTYNRFIGHNEVGDSPEAFGSTAEEFHEQMQYRNGHWPLSINTTSTHDTKRGEDARARLNALTDFPEEWTALVQTWRKQNEKLKHRAMPDANDEYFIYQTLVASYSPEDDYGDRIAEYLQKALREAKTHSNWADPAIEYENSAIGFARALINNENGFHETFIPFLQKVTDYGMINSLSQMLLKFTCPGVPDTYQGTELWDLSLVDPDNRRPVNYELRKKILGGNDAFHELWGSRQNGHIKLALTHQLLQIRAKYEDIFSNGEYIPLNIEGRFRNNVMAFIRKYNEKNILVAVPLHINEVPGNYLHGDWGDTKIILPPGTDTKWEDLLNKGSLNDAFLSHLFRGFPLGLFIHQ